VKDKWIIGILYLAFFSIVYTIVFTYGVWFLPEPDNHSMMFGAVVGGIGCSMIDIFRKEFTKKTD
jgi:hypothetical protein